MKKIFARVVIGLVAFAVPVAGQESPATPVPSIGVEGLRPHVRERIEEARAAVLASSGKAGTWRHLGELYYAHQFYEPARLALAEAWRVQPGNFRTVYMLAPTTDRTVGPPEPVIALFERKEFIAHVDATQSKQDVFADICRQLDLKPET